MVDRSAGTMDLYLKRMQVLIYICIILYFGSDILVPLSFALLISFIIYPICIWLQKKGVGKLTAIILCLFVLLLIGLSILGLLFQQIGSFVNEWPIVQKKLTTTIEVVSELLSNSFGIATSTQNEWLSNLADQSGSSFLSVLSSTLSASAVSIVMMVLIPVYIVLILYYRNYWMLILYRIFPSEPHENLKEIIGLTISAYYNFIKGMGIVYLTVGVLNSVGLLLLGVPHAILFGFVASVLTFIPYVGIIVGSLLPITMAWITYDSIWYPIGIIGIFTFVQYLEANVIFPLAVSYRLNVNTLVMLLSILIGGLLWGMAGMILFVPFCGILKLIADHNPKWKTLSMILGTPK